MNPFLLPHEDAATLREMLIENHDYIEIVEFDRLFNQREWFHRVLIQYLAHLDFPEEDAQIHFAQIKKNRIQMTNLQGRDLGIRVAALDYFSNHLRIFKNATFTESRILDALDRENRLDAKTGCFNSGFFELAVQREFGRARRYGQNFSLMIIDLDNFKYINDNHGHLTGDLVLKRFAELLVNEVRSEDLVGRFGGDEFVVLMPLTDETGAKTLALRIHERILEQFSLNHSELEKVALKFSGGIASFPEDGTSYESLLESADMALYRSKLSGKNRIIGISDLKAKDYVEKDKEKRWSPRIEVKEIHEFTLKGDEPLVDIQATLMNISTTGAFLDCKVQLSSEILGRSLVIKSKDGFPIGEPLKGVIARNAHQFGQIQFRLGVSFHPSNVIPETLLSKTKSNPRIPVSGVN